MTIRMKLPLPGERVRVYNESGNHIFDGVVDTRPPCQQYGHVFHVLNEDPNALSGVKRRDVFPTFSWEVLPPLYSISLTITDEEREAIVNTDPRHLYLPIVLGVVCRLFDEAQKAADKA